MDKKAKHYCLQLFNPWPVDRASENVVYIYLSFSFPMKAPPEGLLPEGMDWNLYCRANHTGKIVYITLSLAALSLRVCLIQQLVYFVCVNAPCWMAVT